MNAEKDNSNVKSQTIDKWHVNTKRIRHSSFFYVQCIYEQVCINTHLNIQFVDEYYEQR